jgi:S-DNA-T family DNA segregation ATPase FtsK/SpoIIIE
MTDLITEAPVGTVHQLDDHRPPVVPVQLVKQPPAPAGVDAPAAAAPSWARSRTALRVARVLATHDRTRTGVRFAVRHGSYVIGGTRIVTRRTWEGRTTAVHQRMIQAAAAAGQHEVAADWQDKADRFRQARHARRMALITGVPSFAKGAVIGAALLEGGLLGLGTAMAVSSHHIADVVAPTEAVISFVHLLCVIVGVVWGPILTLAPWAALLGLWAVGKARGAAPAWAMPVEGDTRNVVPDEGAILDALRHLSLPSLDKAVKAGWQPRWNSPTVRLGNGWHSQLQLPLGVTVEMVNGKKSVLAHNLMRKPIEVWPTEPTNQPGVLDLWVADQGSLSGTVPPWPLLAGGEADYFKGVPVGVSQRGEPVLGKLMAANYMVGGIMGSGKSSLVISLLLGAMLDRLVEIDVYVMAFNVDYDVMKPRLRTLVKGDDDEQVEAALKALRSLRDEVTLRGKLLDELGGEEVVLTRKVAERDPRMRPRVVVFDECHELFEHKKYGPEAAELAVKVMKKARKVGITLVFLTVSPTAASIPKDVTRNTSHRVAFAVGDHVANDGLLGTGKHRAGITATTLNPAENVGTALTVGFTRNPFELIRSYYVKKDASTDQISPVVARAVALRDGVTAAPAVPADEQVDPLADIAAILADKPRMLTQEVIQRLIERNPSHYQGWTFRNLRQLLSDVGHGEYKTDGGRQHVSASRIREALAERANDTAEGDGA